MKPVLVGEDVLRAIDLSDYRMEKKYDGIRVLVVVADQVSLWTRHKRKYRTPESILEELRRMNLPHGTVLDGELWEREKRGGWEEGDSETCQIALWDCVSLRRKDLSDQPIERRRVALRNLVDGKSDRIWTVEDEDPSIGRIMEINEEALKDREFPGTRSGSIHGVVLKRKGSPRRDRPNRSAPHPDWLKVVFEGMKGWEPARER